MYEIFVYEYRRLKAIINASDLKDVFHKYISNSLFKFKRFPQPYNKNILNTRDDVYKYTHVEIRFGVLLKIERYRFLMQT